MKSYIQAIIGTLAAILLAYMFIWVAKENLGLNPESEMLDAYNNYMLEAKSYFTDNSDGFQELSMGIFDMQGLELYRGKSGGLSAMEAGGFTEPEPVLEKAGAADAGSLAASAQELMYGGEVEIENSDGETLVSEFAEVESVRVTDEGVYYYTHFKPDGVVGFMYLREGAEPAGYSRILMVGNWYIFYEMEN